MSCYTCFFVKIGDNFARLGAYSRNHAIARTLNDCRVEVPWEKVTNVTDEMIKEAIDYTRDMITHDKEMIKKYNEEIDMVRNMPETTLDEKLEKVFDINTYIDEVKDDIEEWNYANNFFVVLANAMDDAKYGNDNDTVPVDSQHYLYWGLEISSPTINDIV